MSRNAGRKKRNHRKADLRRQRQVAHESPAQDLHDTAALNTRPTVDFMTPSPNYTCHDDQDAPVPLRQDTRVTAYAPSLPQHGLGTSFLPGQRTSLACNSSLYYIPSGFTKENEFRSGGDGVDLHRPSADESQQSDRHSIASSLDETTSLAAGMGKIQLTQEVRPPSPDNHPSECNNPPLEPFDVGVIQDASPDEHDGSKGSKSIPSNANKIESILYEPQKSKVLTPSASSESFKKIAMPPDSEIEQNGGKRKWYRMFRH